MAPKTVTCKLTDRQNVVVRAVDPAKDLDPLVAFYTSLPPELRSGLRYDVTDRDICVARLKQIDNANHWRLVAEVDGSIVGEGALDRERFGWARHIADVRHVIDPKFEHTKLREYICEQLVIAARTGAIERLTAEVLAEQQDSIEMLKKLGFVYELTRHRYAKGVDGSLHDLVVLSNDLEAVWDQLEEHLRAMDSYFAGMEGQN